MQITRISPIPFSKEQFKRQLCFLSACELACASLTIPLLQLVKQAQKLTEGLHGD